MKKEQLAVFKRCLDDLVVLKEKRVWDVWQPKLIHERIKDVFDRLDKIGIRSVEMIKSLVAIKENDLDLGYQYLFVSSDPKTRLSEAYNRNIGKPEGSHGAMKNLVEKYKVEARFDWNVRK